MAMMAAVGGIISGVASMAGAAASASAQRQEADNIEAAGAYNQREHQYNAAVEQSRGAAESEKEKKKGEEARARMNAGMAQSGVVLGEGTPLLLQQELTGRQKYNESVAMFEGLQKQRTELARGDLAKWKADTEATALRNKASATLLSGFTGAIGGISKAFG